MEIPVQSQREEGITLTWLIPPKIFYPLQWTVSITRRMKGAPVTPRCCAKGWLVSRHLATTKKICSTCEIRDIQVTMQTQQLQEKGAALLNQQRLDEIQEKDRMLQVLERK